MKFHLKTWCYKFPLRHICWLKLQSSEIPFTHFSFQIMRRTQYSCGLAVPNCTNPFLQKIILKRRAGGSG